MEKKVIIMSVVFIEESKTTQREGNRIIEPFMVLNCTKSWSPKLDKHNEMAWKKWKSQVRMSHSKHTCECMHMYMHTDTHLSKGLGDTC